MRGRIRWFPRRYAEPRIPLSAWSLAMDCAIAVAATAVVIAEAFRYTGGDTFVPFLLHGRVVFEPGGAPGPSASTLVICVLSSLPLALRRRFPLAVCLVVVAAVVAGTHTELPAVSFATAVFAVYSAVVYSPYPQVAVGVALAGVVIATLSSPDTLPRFPARYTALIAVAPTIAVALGMRVWRSRARESAARLRRAQAEHEAATRHALELERARIAAELHDVVTHNVSVMLVQAGAARQILDSSPSEAREALLAVEASGRAAMTELRALVGLICQNGDNPDELLRPQPGLSALGELIDRVKAAGLKVELHATGLNGPALPPGLDLAAYRVVQEGLTNVIKHAGQAPATVRLSHRLGELVISVSDTGSGGAGSGGAGSGGTGSGGPGDDPGRGLIGLRERLALYGGSLDAGPRPGGGWRLRARVPLEAS